MSHCGLGLSWEPIREKVSQMPVCKHNQIGDCWYCNIEHQLNFLHSSLELANKNRKQPHKCPVCYGEIKILIDPSTPLSGIQAMFGKRDENGMYYKDCLACKGEGIIWG